ncbi:hypothetical protein PG984_013437 [Apiospora sp. TS-2023a]
MDPLSALSLSCNVLDLIEKAVKCALLVKKLHDGASMEIGEDAETVYDNMQELQTSMDNILAHCEEHCLALDKVLCKCKPTKKSSWRSAGAAAIRLKISKSDIEGLERKLKEQRTALGMLELQIIRDSTDDINRQLYHVNLKENRILVQLDDVITKVEDSIRPLRDKVDDVLAKMMESDAKVKHQLIIRSLEFVTMDQRLDDIHDPSKDTFNWIFDDPNRLKEEKTLEITLTDWLQHGSGIFHIAEMGSVGQQAASICQFFFWRITSVKEKKSLKGLIRGLLHNVLSQVPGLSSILFPMLWQQKLSASDGRISFRITDREAATAFETLMESDEIYDKLRIRLCFFIDGLDEFEEDIALQRETYRDLAMKLRKWAYNPSHSHIKMCVASRPMTEFTSVFETSQRITLEKHTKADIKKFIHDELEVNELFQELRRTSRDNALNCDSILLEVIDRADGIFLWVALVTQLLKQELSTGGGLQSLLNIVASSNPTLNQFFEQIIHSIPYHHRLAASYLLVASMHLSGYFINPEDNLRLFTNFAQVAQEHEPIVIQAGLDLWDSATIFALAEKHRQTFLGFEGHANIPKIEMVKGDAQYGIEQKRLESRCRGLLELNDLGQLVFIHRSIPEALREYFQQERQAQVKDKKVSEMLAWIALAGATRDRPVGPVLQRQSVLGIFSHLSRRNLEGCESIFRILRRIDDVLIHPRKHRGSFEPPWIRLHTQREMSYIIEINVWSKSERWLQTWPDIISLSQACGIYEYIVDTMVESGLNLETLADTGNEGNGKAEIEALWYEFIGRELHFRATRYNMPDHSWYDEMHGRWNWRGIEAFLRLGANADISLVQTDNTGSIVGPRGNILFTVSEDYYKSGDFNDEILLVKLRRSPMTLRDFVVYEATVHDIPNGEFLLDLIDRSISEKAASKQGLRRISFLDYSHSVVVFLLGIVFSVLVYRLGSWENFGLKTAMV